MHDIEPDYHAGQMRPSSDALLLPGCVRVTRVLVYEGPEKAVEDQIARSIDEGRHVLPNGVILTISAAPTPLVGSISANKVEVYNNVRDLSL